MEPGQCELVCSYRPTHAGRRCSHEAVIAHGIRACANERKLSRTLRDMRTALRNVSLILRLRNVSGLDNAQMMRTL